MERTDKQENNRRREPPNSAACQSSVWLHEQVDDPPESQRHEKSQVIDDPSLKLVCSTVWSGGKQRDEDVQPDRLDQIQLVDVVERGADEPAPHHHSHKSSEEDIDDNKEKVADNVASPFPAIAHDQSFSSPGRNVRVL